MARSRAHLHARRSRSPRDNRRAYSQNFLVDPQVAAALARLSGAGRDDLVVEVGPGNGTLTKALARKVGKVLAYEIDSSYAARLAARYREQARVQVVNCDFLTVAAPRRPFSLVANIPYSRTSGIVDWCLRARSLTSATMLTQWEYARKRSGDFGRWSQITVASWPEFEWRLCGRVARTKFNPEPRVDSGILQLSRRSRLLLPRRMMSEYVQTVQLGFHGTGGSLHASLRRQWPARALRHAFDHAEIDMGAVVGYVTPHQWVAMFRRLHGLT